MNVAPPGTVTLGMWAAGVASVLAALVRLVPKFRELWLRLRDMFRSVDEEAQAKQDLRASLLTVRRITAIKAVLDSWVVRKGAQRCLLLTANNGGADWKAGGSLFVSNPQQAVGPGEPNTWQAWQGWKCDAWYTAFLGRLLEAFDTRRGMLLVREVDVDGELRNAYTDQGTVASVVLPFKWVSGSVLWYVSINFGRSEGEPSGKITDEEVKQFTAAAREIYSNPGKCRTLIDELRAAFDGVR